MDSKIEKIKAQIYVDCKRVCCVCHDEARKHVVIHHIDGNHENNDYQNLALLCFECHGDTQVKGAFSQRLRPIHVRKFRDNWISQVSSEKGVPGTERVRHYPGLILDPSHAPCEAFLKQLYEGGILPQGVSYEFVAYSFTMHGMIHIITDCSDINPSNAYEREGVLSAYVQCGLGAILPPGMVFTDTTTPDQDSAPYSCQAVRDGPTSRVPRWFVAGCEDTGLLHVTVDYDRWTNQVFLFFNPFGMVPGRIDGTAGDYKALDGKLDQIAHEFVGKSLAL